MIERLQEWKQSGAISMWRYVEGGKSYKGWHLSADAVGCSSLTVLIDAIARSESSAYRTVVLTPPPLKLLSSVNRRSGPVEILLKLKMEKGLAANEWRIVGQGDRATFSLGGAWHEKLAASIKEMSERHDDFLMGPMDDSQKLWFWSWPLSLGK